MASGDPTCDVCSNFQSLCRCPPVMKKMPPLTFANAAKFQLAGDGLGFYGKSFTCDHYGKSVPCGEFKTTHKVSPPFSTTPLISEKNYQKLIDTMADMNDPNSPLCLLCGPLQKLPTRNLLLIAEEGLKEAAAFVEARSPEKDVGDFDSAVLKALAALLSCLEPQRV